MQFLLWRVLLIELIKLWKIYKCSAAHACFITVKRYREQTLSIEYNGTQIRHVNRSFKYKAFKYSGIAYSKTWLHFIE